MDQERPFFWPKLPKKKRVLRKPPYVRGGDKRISKPLWALTSRKDHG
jgi:hypothetical protein